MTFTTVSLDILNSFVTDPEDDLEKGIFCQCPENCDDVVYSQVKHLFIYKVHSCVVKCYSGAAQEVTSGPFRDISDYYYQNAVTGECGGGPCPITNKGINKEYLELMGYYPSDSYCVERQVQSISIAGIC